jgi:hypothetical protein
MHKLPASAIATLISIAYRVPALMQSSAALLLQSHIDVRAKAGDRAAVLAAADTLSLPADREAVLRKYGYWRVSQRMSPPAMYIMCIVTLLHCYIYAHSTTSSVPLWK